MGNGRLAVGIDTVCLTVGAPAFGQPEFALFDRRDEWFETDGSKARDVDEDGVGRAAIAGAPPPSRAEREAITAAGIRTNR